MMFPEDGSFAHLGILPWRQLLTPWPRGRPDGGVIRVSFGWGWTSEKSPLPAECDASQQEVSLQTIWLSIHLSIYPSIYLSIYRVYLYYDSMSVYI